MISGFDCRVTEDTLSVCLWVSQQQPISCCQAIMYSKPRHNRVLWSWSSKPETLIPLNFWLRHSNRVPSLVCVETRSKHIAFPFPLNHIVLLCKPLGSQLQDFLINGDQVFCSVAAAPVVLNNKLDGGVEIDPKRDATLHFCEVYYPPQGGPLIKPERSSSSTSYFYLYKRSGQSSILQ